MAEEFADPADIFSQFGDIFGDLFGTSSKRGSDLRMTITLDLAEIDAGTKRVIDVDRFVFCAECAGRGAPAEVDATACEVCEGVGAHQRQQGFFAMSTTCEECRGKGEIFERHCAECEGEGGRAQLESLTVSVPAGVTEGQTLRLKGKGNDLGQGAGDLYCAIHMIPDRRFSREGDDLHASLELTPELLSDTTDVALPFGIVEVRVPADAKAGDRIRLRGHGITKLGSPAMPRPTGQEDPYRSVGSEHRGDLVVHLIDVGAASPYSDHAILGVAPGASPNSIKAAYRRLAVKLHPDRHPDDPEAAARFAKVSEAYARLTAPMPDAEPTRQPESARPPSTWMWVALLVLVAGVIYMMTK